MDLPKNFSVNKRQSLYQLWPGNEWGHLVPLKLSPPLPAVTKTRQRAANAFRQATTWALNQRANVRNCYRVQYAQYGTAGALTNTARQIVKVLYQMVIDKQRYATGLLANRKFVNRNHKKARLIAPVHDWTEQFRSTVEDLRVSVVIPTKNAGIDLRQLLSTLKNQRGFKDIEIIIVDSGSTDETLAVARDFAATIIEIAPDEFSHSYARNLGAERATGDYVLFTVQDALPPCDTWLRELYQPIQNDGVIASSCAESPRRDSDLFYRTLCWQHYTFLGLHNRDRILQKPKRSDYGSVRANVNVSDIACLIRRDIFLSYKFRGDYAEDMDLALRLVQDDYKLALLSSTRVIHSHNRPAYYHLKRGYVDTLLLFSLFREYQAQAVEASSLMDDMLRVYECLNGLLANYFTTAMKSCPMAELSAIVMEGLAGADKQRGPITIRLGSNPNIDESFQRFIETVYTRHCATNDRLPSNGALLSDVRAFVSAMLEYMQRIYDVLDGALLEDFRKSLFKAFAFNTGIRLAAGVSTGSEKTKKILQELCMDLRHAI